MYKGEIIHSNEKTRVKSILSKFHYATFLGDNPEVV